MTEEYPVRLLAERGVTLEAVARMALELQRPYNPALTLNECLESAHRVVAKREVQNALVTGITLDRMAEAGTLEEPLRSMVRGDDPLYGVDEVLALTVVNVYGSIGLSNFGFLARRKPDFLAGLTTGGGRVHTFLDDLAAALVAAVCARLAHRAGEPAGSDESGGEEPA